MTQKVYNLRVFAAGPDGGNPLPVVVDAQGMSDAEMQAVAATHGHESGFVFPAPEYSDCDFRFAYWVPEHEMEMCGHATVGAIWLLEKLDRLPRDRDEFRVWTKSGIVEARISGRQSHDDDNDDDKEGKPWVEISQPRGVVDTITDEADIDELLDVLGISASDLANSPIQNAKTSRVKTLIPIKSVDQLDGLKPRFSLVKQLCERIGSTGLYPYALSNEASQIVAARQFPKSSGYDEDAATGIAAAALAYGLLQNKLVKDLDEAIKVRQGWAMGCPSEISVRFRRDTDGCWIGGSAVEVENH